MSSEDSKPRKMLFLIFVLPLLLILLASWQISRSYSPTEVRAELKEVQSEVVEFNNIQQQKGPDFQIEFDDGQKAAVGVVIQRGNTYINKLQDRVVFAQFSAGLAWSALIAALVTLVIGSGGILYIRSLGKRALTSRESLLKQFVKGKKVLPWILCTTALGLIFTITIAVIYELLMSVTYHLTGNGVWKIYIAAIVFILGLLWFGLKMVWNIFKSSRATFESNELTVMGRELSQEDAPALWDFVLSVSQRTHTVMPDTIVVGLDEGFFVTENPVHLYKSDRVTRGRVLYLPLPFMAFMDKAETSTIIAHELGHFTGADTEYSLRFSPIYSAAINNLSAIYTTAQDSDSSWVSKPTLMLGHYFLDAFHEAVQFWSRERELAADSVGAQAADDATFASALMRVVSLSPHVNRALGIFWHQAGEGNTDVIQLVRESIAEHGFGDMEERLNEHFPHPTDSHPTLTQRLAARNVPIDDQLLQKAASVQESTLLKELGLAEGESAATQTAAEQSAESANHAAMAGASITKHLEADFAQEAAQSIQEKREVLNAYAQEGTETITVYESKRFLQIILLVLIVVSLNRLVTSDPVELIVRVGAAAGVLIFILWLLIVHRAAKKAVATLSPEGFVFRNMASAVPWHQLADISIQETTYNGSAVVYSVKLLLEEGTPVPAISGRKLKYNKSKNMIQVTMGKLHKVKMDDFFEDLNAHWRGGSARYQLACMDEAAGKSSNK